MRIRLLFSKRDIARAANITEQSIARNIEIIHGMLKK